MKPMQVREFTEEGVREFEQILDDARNGRKIPDSLRNGLLESGYVLPSALRAAPARFSNRLGAGKSLVQLLKGYDSFLNKPGVWAWLSLYYFDSVCPEADGARVVRKQRELYIPDFTNFRRYYRHLLYGPFSICRAHADNPERAMAVLCTPVHQPGDAVESLASRQDLITSPSVMQAATDLYVRDGRHKRGAGRKNRGGARRFADVMMQFDMTYDLDQIPVRDLLELLPLEFAEFRR